MLWHRLCSIALALYTALGATAADAALPALSVRQNGTEILVFAIAQVAADNATAWDVLTGYDRLPQFIPNMSASRAVGRDGSDVLVLQSGYASLGPFKRAFSLTLAVHEVWHQLVTAHAVAGDFRRFESSYRLTSDGTGHTEIEYSAVIEPVAGIPPLVGLPVMRSAIRDQFEAMLAEIDRLAQLRAGRAADLH
jgi:ribosome-associated toxin RatA of RatAB toxin-antitoxin module